MISRSTQSWVPGAEVRVGFLTLKVAAIVPTPRDGRPDAYVLESLKGGTFYRFVPHYGLTRCESLADAMEG